MEKITAGEIARIICGRMTYGDLDTVCASVDIDSRRIKPGGIFFAMKGTVTDGHRYIDSAVENGAVCIVIEKPFSELEINETSKKVTFIEVISSERALGMLAIHYRSKYNIPVVGVTGSVGKTTTKEMIYSVISEKYNALKSPGNYNSETGLPLSVINLTKEHGAAVFEMGMDAAGEIDYLTKIAKPTVAVITNIGVSHIETLGSRKNILKAKLEIENGLGPEGTMVLNADDDMLFSAKDKLYHPALFYGIDNKTARYRAENIVQTENGTEFDVVTPYGRYKVSIKAYGKHNVYNALAAVVTGYLSGLNTGEIIRGLKNFENERMRQNIYDLSGITIMEDCYNASPDSMSAAFDVISARKEDPKIAVLGDMMELGANSAEYHFEVGKKAAEVFDTVICYGKESKNICDGINSADGRCKKCYWCENTDETAKKLIEIAENGCIILFKASRGMKAEDCLEKLKESWK